MPALIGVLRQDVKQVEAAGKKAAAENAAAEKAAATHTSAPFDIHVPGRSPVPEVEANSPK